MRQIIQKFADLISGGAISTAEINASLWFSELRKERKKHNEALAEIARLNCEIRKTWAEGVHAVNDLKRVA